MIFRLIALVLALWAVAAGNAAPAAATVKPVPVTVDEGTSMSVAGLLSPLGQWLT